MANEKRLIDAVRYGEVLERYINAPHVKVFGKYSDGMQLAINTCIELLNAQRTVDAVEVVYGEWVKQVEDEHYWYECSECGGVVPRTRYGNDWYSDYCPNCGAKMDGGNEDG